MGRGGGSPRANLVTKVLSSDSGRQALERILDEAKAEVTRMLEHNRHVVEALRDALLERDELVGEAIGEVIADAERRVIDLRRAELPS